MQFRLKCSEAFTDLVSSNLKIFIQQAFSFGSFLLFIDSWDKKRESLKSLANLQSSHLLPTPFCISGLILRDATNCRIALLS